MQCCLRRANATQWLLPPYSCTPTAPLCPCFSGSTSAIADLVWVDGHPCPPDLSLAWLQNTSKVGLHGYEGR